MSTLANQISVSQIQTCICIESRYGNQAILQQASAILEIMAALWTNPVAQHAWPLAGAGQS